METKATARPLFLVHGILKTCMPELPKAIKPEMAPSIPEAMPEPVEIAEQPEVLKETESARGESTDAPVETIAPEPLPAPTPITMPVAPPKDAFAVRIESVLSEDLTDVFLKMSPVQQAAFKQKGEETAGKIQAILASAKVNAKKILDLIRDWLKMIPGVNKFFLEQDAKIKTDRLMLLAEEEKTRRESTLA